MEKKTVEEQKSQIAELEDTIRDLYMNIEARDKLQEMDLEDGELEGGTLSLPPEKRKPGKGKGRKK